MKVLIVLIRTTQLKIFIRNILPYLTGVFNHLCQKRLDTVNFEVLQIFFSKNEFRIVHLPEVQLNFYTLKTQKCVYLSLFKNEKVTFF
jgi:hypothetical protein